ncbi:NCS2 family permease [Schaalia sp. ZJ1691]|uniref:NCS2 family permease n=1 Tax=Schaalia sp. ZJ1691 TaxID=2709404 RepID=UPI0013EB3FBB|nr:NCS2 family permease [Schaalia sp. ZJ1691]
MSTKQKAAPSQNAAAQSIDRFFHISERGSTIGREIRGGIVTFFAMAYILVVNPSILGAALPDDGSITTGGIAAGTALVAGIMTILMGVIANYPLALAAGLGLNAIVAFTLVLGQGLTYGEAMGLVAWEGILILLLVLTGFREAVFRAVPQYLKTAITVGLGLFIALVGLVNAGIIRTGATPVEFGISGSITGWPMFVFIFGLFLMFILYVRNVKGAVFISILASTVLAVIVEAVAKIGAFSAEQGAENLTGWKQGVPALQGSPVQIPVFDTLGKVDFFGAFGKLNLVAVILLIFSLMLADFFDTMGTMVAVGAEGNLLDKDGNPPRTRQILVVDSLAAFAGGVGGVSSNTSYIESASGVGEGARTGLASVVTGLLFLLSTFFAPLVQVVPTEAASTALVFVGFLMMTQVTDIDWTKPEIGLPAFMTLAFMPFGYSITVGIGVGFLTYVVLMVACGKVKKVHPLMWFVALLFIIYFLLGPIEALFA